MEPITVVFDDDKMVMLREFIKEHGELRRVEFGEEFNSIDYVCGAMAVYFALGLENKIPASWIFSPMRGLDPLNNEDCHKIKQEKAFIKRLKGALDRVYTPYIEAKTGWLTSWGTYYACGYEEHGDFAAMAERIAREFEIENDLDEGDMQYMFDGWLTLNFAVRLDNHTDVYATRNGLKALTPEQKETLQEIVDGYPGEPFAEAAEKALRKFSEDGDEANDHWFEKE